MKTARTLFLLCMLVCWLQSAHAQSPGTPFEKGYIEMKDGRIIKGRYVYSPELDRVRILTDESSFVVKASDVVRITRKKPSAGKPEGKDKSDEPDKPKHCFFFSELGILPGNPDNPNRMPLLFHASANYLLSKKFSVGAGAGVEFYRETYLPVTVNGLYRFSKDKVSPFAGMQIGYQVPVEGSRTKVQNVLPHFSSSFWPAPIVPYETGLKAKGGILLNPSLGVMWQNRSGTGFSFSAGYRFHRLRYNNKEQDYDLKVDYRRLSLKLGLIF